MDPIQDIDLRELSEYEGPERAFLSVYIGGEGGVQAVSRRLASLRSMLMEETESDNESDDAGEEGSDGPEKAGSDDAGRGGSNGPGRAGGPEGNGSDSEDAASDEVEHFDQNVRMVEQWLAEHPPGEGTTCVFSCWALDLLRGYTIELELPTEVHVGVAPYVRPLAELQDEYQTFAVVAADNGATRVFLVTATQQELAGRIRGDVKSHTKKGGWSQKRYERRRDNELQHYASDVADFLARLAQKAEFDRIVLLGSEETLVAIEEELDQELVDKVIARDTIDLKEGEEALMEEAFEHYREAEREGERELWARVRAEYGKPGGLAAAGPEEVLQAVKTGRVEVVLVERDADIPGVRCAACENTAVGSPETCPYCGASTEVGIDLVDELTRQAERTGAWVEYADPIPGLGRVGGVAALLRY